MEVYCLTAFLDAATLDSLPRALAHVGLDQFLRYEVLTDQTGESSPSLQLQVHGLSVIFLPENAFHRHRDFEIGLTSGDWEAWKQATEQLAERGGIAESGTLEDGGTPYVVLGDGSLHGPYFGIYTGTVSTLQSGDQIAFSLPEREYQFHQDVIAPVLQEELLSCLHCELNQEATFPTLYRLRVHCPGLKEPVQTSAGSLTLEVIESRLTIDFGSKTQES